MLGGPQGAIRIRHRYRLAVRQRERRAAGKAGYRCGDPATRAGRRRGRRLKPTVVTEMAWPLLLTESELGAGVVRTPLSSTKSQLSTRPGSGVLLLMRATSRRVGVSTRRAHSPVEESARARPSMRSGRDYRHGPGGTGEHRDPDKKSGDKEIRFHEVLGGRAERQNRDSEPREPFRAPA